MLPALPAWMPLVPLVEIWLAQTETKANWAPAPSTKMPLEVLLAKTQLRAETSEPDLACKPFPLPDNRTLSRLVFTFRLPELVTVWIPSPVLSRITLFLTLSCMSLLSLTRMPSPANLKITQSSMLTVLAWRMFIPRMPLHEPLIERPLIVITSVLAALMMMPVVREARIDANVPVPSSVIDLVMVTAPKPPGSKASISPQAAVFEMAPAQVLHGAVRLHGLASSPTPDTHVRVACAWAIEATVKVKMATAKIFKVKRTLLMIDSPFRD